MHISMAVTPAAFIPEGWLCVGPAVYIPSSKAFSGVLASQPAGEQRIDNIAGAIAACGMQELAALTGDETWTAQAGRLVCGLLDRCSDWGEERCGILTHCTASYHDDGAGRHTNIVYGDYFLTEALMKLCGKDPGLWN